MASKPRFPNKMEMAKIFNVDKDTWHRKLKTRIRLNCPEEIEKKLGYPENMDIGIDSKNFIWFSLSQDSSTAERSELTIDLFRAEEKPKVKWKQKTREEIRFEEEE